MKCLRPAALFALIGLLGPALSHASFKCWTNSEGVRECGNVIPPEYRAQQTETVNEQGLTIGVQERAKTREEKEAEMRAAAEAKAAAEAEARRKAEQAEYDRVLFSTFTKQEEIIAHRDRNIAAIDGTIEITRITRDKIQEQLTDLKRQAPSKVGKVRADMDADITNLEGQVQRKDEYIQLKEEERAVLHEKYEGYLQRFCQLRNCN